MPSSLVAELSFLIAPYGGWNRAGKKRVQDNLHAHAQNEPIKNYWAVVDNSPNHKNYNFLACDWFKNVLFSTNSLAKLLLDSLLLDSLLLDSLLSDSLISQSHSKM